MVTFHSSIDTAVPQVIWVAHFPFLAAPSSHPMNVSGTALNSTHIGLVWDPPPEMDRRGIIREYRVNITELDTGLMFQTASTTTETTIGPLHPYYTYVSIITAFTVDEGPYSNAVVVRTEEDGELCYELGI